jgi:hypothetical protein
MARVVVIATTDVAREALVDHVAPEDELVVVAPAVEQSRLDWLTNDEADGRARAEAVGESIAGEAPESATSVEVKPDAPSQALLDAIALHAPDRVVVALREGDDATWLEAGETRRIPSEISGVPVVLVTV